MHPPALLHLQAVVQDHIDRGLLPGAVALIEHRGQRVLHAALGAQGPAAGAPPMARDTVFHIY